MPRGPKGEWRPRDPIARAVHVCRILTGLQPETYEPPADSPDPGAAGGRARAANLTPKERSAGAKRAADARWGS